MAGTSQEWLDRKSRAGNLKDIASNNAVFVLRSNGVVVGKPLLIQIPQYAIHTNMNAGLRTLTTSSRLNTNGEHKVVGFCTKFLISDAIVTFLSVYELLGIERPKG